MQPNRQEEESLEQMAVAAAGGMVEAAAHQAYGLFRDKGFRRLTLLEALSQTEQDIETGTT